MIKYFLAREPKTDIENLKADLAVIIKRKSLYYRVPKSIKKVYIDKTGAIIAENFFSKREDFNTSKAILLRYAVILGFARKEQMKYALNRYKLPPRYEKSFNEITSSLKKDIYINTKTNKDILKYRGYISKTLNKTIYEALEAKKGKKYTLLYSEIIDFCINLARSLYYSYIQSNFDLKYFHYTAEGYIFSFVIGYLDKYELTSEDKTGDYLSDRGIKTFVKAFNEKIRKINLQNFKEEYEKLELIQEGILGINDYVYVGIRH